MASRMVSTLVGAAIVASAASEVIPGEFIAQLRPEAASSRTITDRYHSQEDILGTYAIGDTFRAYAFKGDASTALRVAADPSILRVEPNAYAYGQERRDDECEEQGSLISWGLTRINSRALPPEYDETFYSHRGLGADIDAYVLDTGLRFTHEAFANSDSAVGVNCLTGTCREGNAEDDQGHGTHVAGTMAGIGFGVARWADIVPVKVLDSRNSGSWASIIAGVEWSANDCVRRQQQAKREGRAKGTCVGNMSLGGGLNNAVNNAVNAAVREGMIMVVCAMNDNSNACNVSPASASDVITVGATDDADRRSSFSNWGQCVDIMAPGTNITSASHTTDTGIRVMSGTSMASPHVAGIAAGIASQHPDWSNQQIREEIMARATPDIIEDTRQGKNLLAYHRCEDESVSAATQ